MSLLYKKLLQPVLFRFDPESVHKLATLWANNPVVSGKMGNPPNISEDLFKRFHQQLGNLSFTHPIGLAAGFDKNGEFSNLSNALSFSYREVGSVTAQPSAGNQRPRLFRLPQDNSLINRMGLNNHGADVISLRLAEAKDPAGVNIAKTPDPSLLKDAAIDDYVTSYKKLKSAAKYITLNISCPNSGDGKSFENPEPLTSLLSAIKSERSSNDPPIFVKFSADISEQKLAELLQITEDFDINGYVCCNTSTDRSLLSASPDRLQQIGPGGISGRPLHFKSCGQLYFIRRNVPKNRILIGVGGIDGFRSAAATLSCGADLLQIYTGLIYQGPELVNTILEQFASIMELEGLASIQELRSYFQSL